MIWNIVSIVFAVGLGLCALALILAIIFEVILALLIELKEKKK